MYERCSYDDSGPKILGYEKSPFWYSNAFMPVGIDWENGAFN